MEVVVLVGFQGEKFEGKNSKCEVVRILKRGRGPIDWDG